MKSALVEALRDWACDPTPYEPDGRPWHSHTTSGGWAPVGIVHHHTGGSGKLLTDAATQEAMLRMLRIGRPDLVGPLCHLSPAMVPGTTRARVWLVGWGNVNHAGKGCARAADLLRVGRYDGRRPGADVVDGNAILWGLEYMHPGTTPTWPDALVEVGHRAACAIAEVSGWSRPSWPGSNVEHREWTRRKIDRSWPGDLRAGIRAAMTAYPVTTPGPTPPAQEDDDMPTADEIAKAILAQPAGDVSLAVQIKRLAENSIRAGVREVLRARLDAAIALGDVEGIVKARDAIEATVFDGEGSVIGHPIQREAASA